MAGTLYVAEFSQLGLQAEQQAAFVPPLADYKIAVGAGSTQGPQAFNSATRFVRLQCDATNPVSVAFGPFGAGGATATASNMRMAVNQTEYFAVPVAAGWTVAAFPNT